VTPTPPSLVLRPGEAARLRLVDVVTGATPRRATRVELRDDGDRLVARFAAESADPRATLTARDAPLWQEEVVELFVAGGSETPRRYAELEVNPLGALFDALVDSPYGDRAGMRVDTAWDCPGITASAHIDRAAGLWYAELALPWRQVPGFAPDLHEYRINCYRIDRPGDGAATEYSAWSPTLVAPADFHRPERFGHLLRIR
jgi:hypothetical protein